MSSLRRSIAGVVSILFAELRRIAEQEGPEGEYLLSVADITADYVLGRQHIKVELWLLNKPVWAKEIPLSEYEVMSMEDDRFEQTVTAAMRASLSLVAQMHFARLDQMFPKAIKDVRTGYDPEKHVKIIIVEFRNGHVAEAPEPEAKSELFTARCAMLYDLPPL